MRAYIPANVNVDRKVCHVFGVAACLQAAAVVAVVQPHAPVRAPDGQDTPARTQRARARVRAQEALVLAGGLGKMKTKYYINCTPLRASYSPDNA